MTVAGIMCSMQGTYSTKVDQYERIFCASVQGDRKYMEDFVVLDESETATGQTFLAVFDGHGGDSAAKYASDNLWSRIKSKRSGDDLTRAITYGFLRIHEEMSKLKGAVYFR